MSFKYASFSKNNRNALKRYREITLCGEEIYPSPGG